MMKLFGWKAGRDGSRPALARGIGGDAPGQWPLSYDAQLHAAFADNAIGQRSVRLVADSVAAAPLVASTPALVALATARSGGQSLMETVAAQLVLHGNAYVQVLRGAAGEVPALYALRPERVSIEADADGWPAAYRYRVGERVARLAADGPRPEVIHLRCFNPLDDHYGQGCLGAAAGAVAVHNAAARWTKALLDNAARPSGALVYDPGDGSTLSAEQFARLKSEMEAGFAGAGNAGRPMLLEGGLRWQPLSLSPADLDFTRSREAAAREIALAFGVPPMLLGLPGDATYANYREANRALWRQTVLPLADTITTALAQGLAGWFPDARLAVDVNQIPALAEDRALLWASVAAADFLSAAEKRAMLGIAGEAG